MQENKDRQNTESTSLEAERPSEDACKIRALSELAESIAAIALEIVENPHYEIVKTEVAADPEETLALIQKTALRPSPNLMGKIASALRMNPGTRFIRTTNYDTDVNRYARLLLLRMAKTFSRLYPDAKLEKPLLDVLATPFYSGLSPDQTPRMMPGAFSSNRLYRQLSDSERFLNHLARLFETDEPTPQTKKEPKEVFPQDVIVGTFRSAEQFEINFAKRFYYVPAELFDETKEAPKYIALYQSASLFGASAGIRYYGEILSTEKISRKDIPVTCSKSRMNAPYYLFRVAEWKELSEVITPRIEAPLALRYTSFFLLLHAKYSYELFFVHNETEFRLLEALRNSVNAPDETFRLPNGFTVRTENGRIDVRTSDGTFAIGHAFPVSYFEKHPLRVFRQILLQIESDQ